MEYEEGIWHGLKCKQLLMGDRERDSLVQQTEQLLQLRSD